MARVEHNVDMLHVGSSAEERFVETRSGHHVTVAQHLIDRDHDAGLGDERSSCAGGTVSGHMTRVRAGNREVHRRHHDDRKSGREGPGKCEHAAPSRADPTALCERSNRWTERSGTYAHWMPLVDVNNITIEYDERGTGVPLLLIMGLGGQMTAWRDDFVDQLADEGFRVIRFDNRDVGLSTHFDHIDPPKPIHAAVAHVLRRPLTPAYPLSDMASDAVGLLDALNIERAHIMGVSMGGMISQIVALDHPERVLSLTSIMSSTGNRKVGQPSARVMAKLVRRAGSTTRDSAIEASIDFFGTITGPHFDPEDHREYAAASVERAFNPSGTNRQAMALVASPDRTERLRSLETPTLVIHGTLDTLVDPSGGRATAEAIPGARLVMIEGMGHALPKPLWPQVLDAVTNHMRRVDARTSEKSA